MENDKEVPQGPQCSTGPTGPTGPAAINIPGVNIVTPEEVLGIDPPKEPIVTNTPAESRPMSVEEVDAKIEEDRKRREKPDPLALRLRDALDVHVMPEVATMLHTGINEASTAVNELFSAFGRKLESVVSRRLTYARAALAKQLRAESAELQIDECIRRLCRIDPSNLSTAVPDPDYEALARLDEMLNAFIAAEWDKLARTEYRIITIADDAQLRKLYIEHGNPISAETARFTKDIDEMMTRYGRSEKLVGIIKEMLVTHLTTLRNNMTARNQLIVISTPKAYLKKEAYMLESYVFCHYLVLKNHTVREEGVNDKVEEPKTTPGAVSLPFATMPIKMLSPTAAKREVIQHPPV